MIAKRGMSLVEVTIVIVILGVIMAGVFMLFLSGTEHFNFARRQNELDTTGRLALDRITNEIIWAGFMPRGGWDNDSWHPIQVATADSLVFYADYEGNTTLDPDDWRHIMRVNQRIRIHDGGTKTTDIGEFVTSYSYQYLDRTGAIIPFPLDEAARDEVRHIRINMQLSARYTDDVYQTVLHTTISPRNLGVNHNIDPAFFPPQPMSGVIVVNIRGDSANHNPTIDEQAMIDALQLWGFTVTILTDDELEPYDYTDVDCVILRHIPGGATHANPAFFDTLSVPTVTLMAEDAIALYGMGATPEDRMENRMTVAPGIEHGPPNRDLHGTYMVYEIMSGGHQSVLLGMTPGPVDTLYTFAGVDSTASGVYAIDADDPEYRRVHLSAWEASKYTSFEGWKLFYNIIVWLTQQPPEIPGEPITYLEDFEGPGPGTEEITLWADNIVPTAGVDTVPIYYEPFSGGTALSWNFLPLGGGRVFVNGTYLQTDRAAAGASTRNLAILTVDLSAYDMNTDDLVLSVSSASYEGFADADDGVFFISEGAPMQLLFEDFEGFGNAPGDVEFWGDLYGRNRIMTGWGGDGRFVTFDTRSAGHDARNRMMLEAATTGLTPGQVVTLSYRFHDHNDENQSGATGDFWGWNDHGIIDGTVNVVKDLLPASYSNAAWHDRVDTFIAPNPVPNPIFIVFGQRGSEQAVLVDNNDGISIDNVILSIPGDSLYSRIQDPASTSTWTTYHTDLDQAARNNSYQFDATYRMALSQYGGSPVPTGGRLWDDVTISVLQTGLFVDGWTHAPMVAGWNDDWYPKSIVPVLGYSWISQPDGSAQYRNNTYCYLQSPSVVIPSWIDAPTLQFSHSMNCESNYDGGFVQIQLDGGSWTTLTSSSGLTYNGTSVAGYPGGTGQAIFTGTFALRTETVDLTPYKGHTVAFRFIFGSDGGVAGSGWLLDTFRVFGTSTGYQITSIDFEVHDLSMAWNYVMDVYMSSGADSSFGMGGEWSKTSMTLVADDAVLTVGTAGWKTLILDTPFTLPPGANLYIKVEQADPSISFSPVSWAANTPGSVMCRQAADDMADPTFLSLHSTRPNIQVSTTSGPLTPPPGTVPDTAVPLNNNFFFNDCEMIYTAAELGTTGSAGNWTHGGSNDDWEIDEPLVLAVDPPLTPDNGSNVAGNDLTLDGYYMPDTWNWFVSPPYPMPSSTLYDSVYVRYHRCVRLAPNDAGYVFIGFSDDENPPADGSPDWELVRTYDGVNHDQWEYELLNLSDTFEYGWSTGRAYFFLRYVLFAGPFAERGGWNVDNIQFYAE